MCNITVDSIERRLKKASDSDDTVVYMCYMYCKLTCQTITVIASNVARLGVILAEYHLTWLLRV